MLPINPKYVGKKAYTIPTDDNMVNLAVIENHVEHFSLSSDNEMIPQTANFYFGSASKLQALKELLAQHCSASAENIMVTNGSGNALKLILDVFVGPTTRIGILYPNYPGFIHDAELAQGQVIFKSCSNVEDFRNLDFSDIDMLYISNPNLPHGYYLPSELLIEKMTSLPNVLFIIDEAYGEYCAVKTDSEFLIAKQLNTTNRLGTQSLNNVVVVKTLSKSFGLAGMRVGFIVAPLSLLNVLAIAYDSKTLTHEAIQCATIVMQNREYYMAKLREFAQTIKDLKTVIAPLVFRGARIYDALFTDCPWFMLLCEEPAAVCQAFAAQSFLVRDKSSEIPGAVRITIVPQYADQIIEIIRDINFGYDRIIFDLDGTMRPTYKSPIEQFILDKWPQLVSRFDARIITNNCAPRESIMQMLAENGIHDADVIAPITAEMNPLDADWFIYRDELYIIRYPQVFEHKFALAISAAKQINVVETGDTTSSAELDELPDVQLPYIGLLLKYATLINPTAKINVIGKTSLLLNYAGQRVLMIGDTEVDKEFATKNSFDFFDVRFSNLDRLIAALSNCLVASPPNAPNITS